MIRVLTLSLALLIALTSQQMAVARGVMQDASGQVVLCTGQGLVTVTLDAQGNPMEPVHICPDCALNILVMAGTLPGVQMPVVHIQTLAQTPVVALEIQIVTGAPNARGPPLLA